MTNKQSTFEQRISDYNEVNFKDPFTPQERLAILDLSKEQFEQFVEQVMKPLSQAMETMSWQELIKYKEKTLNPIIQLYLK